MPQQDLAFAFVFWYFKVWWASLCLHFMDFPKAFNKFLLKIESALTKVRFNGTKISTRGVFCGYGMKELELGQNQILFTKGDLGESAYIFKSGIIAVFIESNGEKKLLGKITAGGIIGEMALIDHGRLMTFAAAIKDTVVMVVTAAILQEKLSNTDPFIHALLKIMIEQIRNHNSCVFI